MSRISLWVVAVALSLASPALAQFAGGAFFSTAPQSQIGPVTNNLVITNTPTGFTVTGQALINTPPAPPTAAGILVEWVIDRPLAPTFTFTNWTTTTNLVGFSAPPVGAAGNTSGVVSTELTEPAMQAPSQSSITMFLTNGAATWNNTNSSGLFSGATPATPTYYLRQSFFLDGVYLNGPGGTWTIDVPIDSFLTEVPEPASAGALCTLAAFILARRPPKRN